MKNAKDLWLKLYLHGHPWFLDLDRQVLIDCLNMENMRSAFCDGERNSFCFLYPNPNSLDDENMLVRVVRHTHGEGDKEQAWFELKTLLDNVETVRTINACGAYREQEFILFDKERATEDQEYDSVSNPFFGMASFENSAACENPALFEVDFKNFRLVDMQNTENIIPLSSMRDTGKGYEFYYDPQRRKKADGAGDYCTGNTGAYLVRFDYLISLHPRAIAHCHHIPVGAINAKTDREFMVKRSQMKTGKTSLGKIPQNGWQRKLQNTLNLILG